MKLITQSLLVLGGIAAIYGCAATASQIADVPRASLADVKSTGDSPLEKRIEKAQEWIELKPDHPKGYNALGLALMQKGRETAELDNYNQALTAFEKAVDLAPKDSESIHNLAWCWTMFHNFGKAVELSKKAIAIDPNEPFAYGVLTDSYIELGRYDEAIEAAQEMMDMKPDLASYSRAAQLRWIIGDAKGATILWQRAIAAGGPYAENTNWCETQLGDLYWRTGAVAAAQQRYQAVLDRAPKYRHALFGMGRILWTQGKKVEALANMKTATEGNPPIPYVVEYGDLLALSGDHAGANAQFDRVEKMVEDHLKHGIEGDEMALAEFYITHDRKVVEAMKLAKHEIDHHTAVGNYSLLAWCEYKAGRHSEAKAAIDKARKVGTQDAKVLWRASKIYGALGKKDEAKKFEAAAMSLNPNFDLSMNLGN